jgi:tRNA pseudouridine55 synthase
MDGILLIDKPVGITSNDLVIKIKKRINEKIGHTGTLDYSASGLMLLTIGKATRLTEYFQGLDKEYITTGELGKITSTYDSQGEILEEKECFISEQKLKEIILSFQKTYLQLPPKYSSKRIGGKRAYQLAKKGIEVELKPKKVTIYSIEILDIHLPFFTIKVHCSSGTYIRSLIKEIGDETGCGAYVKDLRRTKIDGFSIDEAVPFERVLKMDKNEIEKLVIPIEKALKFFPEIILDEGFDKRFLNGQRFKVPTNYPADTTVKVLSKEGNFLGIGKIKEGNILQPEKVFK